MVSIVNMPLCNPLCANKYKTKSGHALLPHWATGLRQNSNAPKFVDNDTKTIYITCHMLRRDDDDNDDTTSLQVLTKARYTEEKQKDANG